MNIKYVIRFQNFITIQKILNINFYLPPNLKIYKIKKKAKAKTIIRIQAKKLFQYGQLACYWIICYMNAHFLIMDKKLKKFMRIIYLLHIQLENVKT